IVDMVVGIDVTDAIVVMAIGPSYKTTGGKVDAGSAEPYGVDVGVEIRVRGEIQACRISNDLRHLEWMSGK
ncbi:hypothetical protein KI387_007684, partial [Taxus chinensis]